MRNHKILHLLLAEETGVLAFEWVLLAVILSIGIIGGMAVFRDTTVLKLGDLANSAVHLDQSCGGSCLTEDYSDSPGTVEAQ